MKTRQDTLVYGEWQSAIGSSTVHKAEYRAGQPYVQWFVDIRKIDNSWVPIEVQLDL